MAENLGNAVILSSNPGLRDEVKRQVRALGYSILSSGSSAATVLEELSYEDSNCKLIISDLKLEDSTALNFLKKLRTMPDFDDIMVLIAVSDDEFDKLFECMDQGVAGFIKKPFSVDQLVEQLQLTFQRLRYFQSKLKPLFLHTAALVAESINRYKTAIKYHQQVLELVDNALTRFDLGRLYIQTKRGIEARLCFAKALELDPRFEANVNRLAEQLNLLDKGQGATEPQAHIVQNFLQAQGNFSSSCYENLAVQKSMIIGGNHSDRVIIKNTLQQLEFKQVNVQEDVKDAYKLLQDSDYSLIIVWWNLGDSNASELSRKLRQIYNHDEMKIFVICPDQQNDKVVEVLRAGADGYCFFPFTPHAFSERLHRCLILDELTRCSHETQKFAKFAYSMFELQQYEQGSKQAAIGLKNHPHDLMCLLFQTVNIHMLGDKDLAHKQYANLTSTAAVMKPLCDYFKEDLDRKCPGNASDKSAPKASAAKDHNQSVPAKETSENRDPGAGVPPGKLAEKAQGKPRKRRVVDGERVMLTIQDGAEPYSTGDEAPASQELAEDILAAPDATAKNQAADDAGDADEPEGAEESFDDIQEAVQMRQAAEQIKHTRRETNKVRENFLGSFSNIAELQESLFGQIEPAPEAPHFIPQSLAEHGISAANFVQQLGKEQVLSGNKQEVRQANGRIILVEDSVVSWLPTGDIVPLGFKPEKTVMESSGPLPKADRIEFAQSNAHHVKVLAGQAQLLNTRLICLPPKYEPSVELLSYLQSVGKELGNEQMLKVIRSNEPINRETRQALSEVVSDPNDPVKLQNLGRALVNAGYADDFFEKLLSLTQNSSDPRNQTPAVEYAALTEAANNIQKPLVDFHSECLEGKANFENKLPYLMEATTHDVKEFEMLYKAMEEDHNSIEAFKKIYVGFRDRDDQAGLEKFFNDRYKDFLRNKKSRRALYRFLLSIGDGKRARKLLEEQAASKKIDPVELKTLSYACFQDGDFINAIKWCNAMIKHKVFLEHSYNLLGVIYKKMGRLEDAINAYRTGIKHEPESPKLFHNIAITYTVIGDHRKAKTAQARAQKLKKLYKVATDPVANADARDAPMVQKKQEAS
jgi:DNA-binding NarL/FixJ family response regulator